MCVIPRCSGHLPVRQLIVGPTLCFAKFVRLILDEGPMMLLASDLREKPDSGKPVAGGLKPYSLEGFFTPMIW
jgi:hypothetical protein